MMIFYNKISSYHNPHAIIIFAFSLQNIKFLQNRQIALDGALAHRQDLRHLWQNLSMTTNFQFMMIFYNKRNALRFSQTRERMMLH